jgi:hypothetical protein
MQPHGATVWARKTICSDIFISKPDKWFKIWFFVVNRVNYKDNGKYKRAECFIPSGEIEMATGSTTDQVKKCLKWLRDEHSISTRRSTRGIHITVLKYNVYQDLNSYSGTREALDKHQRSTTIGEVSNKEITIGETSSPELKANQEDMSWNKQSDDYEEGIIDLDGDGSLQEQKKTPTRKYPNAPAVRKVFQEVLGKNEPNWKINKTQLQACQNLFTTRGISKIKNALEFYQEVKGQDFCPTIDSPYDLDSKYDKLARFKNKTT